MNPYPGHYSPAFAFSAFSYPLPQQLALQRTCPEFDTPNSWRRIGLTTFPFLPTRCRWACPCSARLFPGSVVTTYSQAQGEQPAAYHFGAGLSAALARLLLRGLSTVHICCACGTCLASTPLCGLQRRHTPSPAVTSFDEYFVPGASHLTVTSHARPSRQLLVVQQVTARRAARDKAETSFAIYYIPLDARRTATRVALCFEQYGA